MAETLISALLPIVVTLFIGCFAAWHKDFTEQQADGINKLIMTYTLPLSLFGGIMTTPRVTIFSHLAVAGWLLLAMVGGYLAALFIAHFILHQDIAISTLRSLAVASSAVPFVGPTILGSLFPTQSALLISLGALIINVIQVPISVILLSGSAHVQASIGENLLAAVKKPVVWAPILAFIIVLCGGQLSPAWAKNFTVLGSATGGLALFASGVILFSRKPILSLPVWINTLSKNIFLPLIMFGLMVWAHTPTHILNMSLMAISIPTGAIGTILASQYHKAEQEMASSLFLSTVLSVFTMGFIIIMRNI
ncbi:MAG: AEC family transporter [Schleiferilactobacillus perolens]|uniref:AEC family transporter n=1 Tax=Schleiferilactobacillus perolens TaxID=100468 RepID=UPI0039E903AB